MPDINGIPYVESTDLVSAYPAVSLALAQELDDQLASKADYPSGGTDGDMLVKDGTSTDWVTPSVAGLTLITTQTVTTSSQVSINSCFSSTYDHYKVLVSHIGSTTNNMLLQYGTSGTPNSNTNYRRGGVTVTTAGIVDATNGTGLTSIYINANTSTQTTFSVLEIGNPNKASYTTVTAMAWDINNNRSIIQVGSFDATTQFTDLVLLTNTGTWTGTVSVLGYRK